MSQAPQSNFEPLLINQSIKESQQDHNTGEGLTQIEGNLEIHEDTQSLENSSITQTRKIKRSQICSVVCILLGLFMTLFMPALIDLIMRWQVRIRVYLNPQIEDLWAHVPGGSGTKLIRNFTFHTLDNHGEFLFNHQKPSFREIQGYTIQQLEDYLDIQYLDDGNLVKVRDWLRFKQYPGRNLDENVTIINMANLGFWETLKAARPTLLLQQGLALLFTSLEQSIIPMLVGQAISQVFLANSSLAYSAFLSPAGISKQNADFMWNDPPYGLSSAANVGFWTQASIDCFENPQKAFIFSNDAIILKNHYVLTDFQLKSLMEKIYGQVKTLYKLAFENHYCVDIKMDECTGRYLTVAQLAQSFVTVNIPPVGAISPTDSICQNNNTCQGLFPEPYAFANNVFRIEGKLAEQLGYDPKAIIKFPREAVLGWFNYNHSIEEGLNYNTAQNCLLHIGNLDALWEMGTAFDKSLNTALLEPIKARFKLETPLQALIFWKWIQYFIKDFGLQGYNNANAGIADLFATGLYTQFTFLKDNLQPFLLAKMLSKSLQNIECFQFFEQGLQQSQNPSFINYLCDQYKNIHSYNFSLKMYNVCERKYGEDWHELNSFGARSISIDNLCAADGAHNVGALLHAFKLELDEQYGCKKTPNPYCSNYELALMQWHNSSVTLNPPKSLSDLPKGNSFSLWFKQAKQIEYNYFIQRYFSKEQDKFPRYSLNQLYSMFTFQNLLSAGLLIKMVGEQTFHPYFFKYVRYVCIYMSLNGYTATQTVRQFLFGYDDKLLSNVRQMYPPFGGDPSAPELLAFNEPNITEAEANAFATFKTGKDDYRNVFQYQQANGLKYLAVNFSWFNGNKSVWEWRTPWAEQINFYGTPGRIFSPDLFESDNISIFIPQVQRYGSLSFLTETVKVQKYGLDLHLGHIPPKLGEVSQQTKKFYQRFPFVFNASSIYGIPVCVTKNHYMNATEWLDKVNIYNQNKSIHYTTISQYDDSILIIEPYTGASIEGGVYLQSNYYHQKDILYDYPIDILLPVFSIFRSANVTEEAIKNYLWPLTFGKTMKIVVFYLGIGLSVLSAAVFIFCTLKKRKLTNEIRKSEFLGISLQQVYQDDSNSSDKPVKQESNPKQSND